MFKNDKIEKYRTIMNLINKHTEIVSNIKSVDDICNATKVWMEIEKNVSRLVWG